MTSHQPNIDAILLDSPRFIPQFVYELADHRAERIVTFVPIAVGDTITAKLTTGELLKGKRVLRIGHIEPTVSVGTQILATLLHLED